MNLAFLQFYYKARENIKQKIDFASIDMILLFQARDFYVSMQRNSMQWNYTGFSHCHW